MSINWTEIRQKLPFQRTPEQFKQRMELWNGIDINGNGHASLAEIDKGLRDILQCEEVFDCKPAIMRAF